MSDVSSLKSDVLRLPLYLSVFEGENVNLDWPIVSGMSRQAACYNAGSPDVKFMLRGNRKALTLMAFCFILLILRV